jgi:hypothetical protein
LEGAQTETDSKIPRHTFRAQSASKIEAPRFTCFSAGQSLGPERKRPPGKWALGVRFVPAVRLFTNGQVNGRSTTIIVIGINATMAAMSLAE